MSKHEHHGMQPLGGLANYCRHGHRGERREDRFGRMFPELSPSYVPQPKLAEVGRAGGPMDAGGSKEKTDTVPVGLIFFGQFVDHDITLDTSTSFADVVENAAGIANLRSPTLDLDCIYGLGPEAQPYLYDQTAPFDGAKLLTGASDASCALARHDLLRAPNGRAIIGDPRNDENRIISQLQLAMIRFHNHVCDVLHDEAGLAGHGLYEEARRETTWHYQWNVVRDYLTAICGAPVVDDILSCGRDHYCGDLPFIPVEFSVAAYRFGHSMIPMQVQIQAGGEAHDLFGSVLGGGFEPLGSIDAVVDFNQLLNTNGNLQPADKLDTKLASTLLQLPFIGAGDEASLAVRNLMRGNVFLLPGGDKIAERMGRDEGELDEIRDRVEDLGSIGREGIPLWLYVLAEAETIGRAEPGGNRSKGEGLGPVGARIVAETLIGLLELDDRSFLGANRNWSPRNEWDSVGKMLTVAG